MPSRPRANCSHPGCPNRKPCPDHAPKPWAHGGRTAAARGYDHAWRKARARQLQRHPRCWCGRRASEVDHIVPLEDGGARLDSRNLQSLCHHHHQAKTNSELARRRRQRAAG